MTLQRIRNIVPLCYSGGFRLGPGGTAPKSCPGPQFLIGSIVISLSRCCLPNDEGSGPKYFFLEPPLLCYINSLIDWLVNYYSRRCSKKNCRIIRQSSDLHLWHGVRHCPSLTNFSVTQYRLHTGHTVILVKSKQNNKLECVAKPSLMDARPLNWSKRQSYLSPVVDQSTRAPQQAEASTGATSICL